MCGDISILNHSQTSITSQMFILVQLKMNLKLSVQNQSLSQCCFLYWFCLEVSLSYWINSRCLNGTILGLMCIEAVMYIPAQISRQSISLKAIRQRSDCNFLQTASNIVRICGENLKKFVDFIIKFWLYTPLRLVDYQLIYHPSSWYNC